MVILRRRRPRSRSDHSYTVPFGSSLSLPRPSTPIGLRYPLRSPATPSSSSMLRAALLLLVVAVAGVYGQEGLGSLFALPNAQRYANKPMVPPDLQQYFDLEGSARTFVDSLIGPRPGGLFPEKNFEVGSVGGSGSQPQNGNFFSGNPGPQYNLPPGFQQGFSLVRGGNSASVRRSQAKQIDDHLEEGSGTDTDTKSSIDGIPNVYPNLPKAPIAQPTPAQVQPRVVAGSAPQIPKLSGRPEVPEGGLGPLASNSIQSTGGESSLPAPQPIPDDAQYGVLTSQPTSQGGLIGSLLSMIGLNGNAAAGNDGPASAVAAAPTFSGARLGSAISGLFGGKIGAPTAGRAPGDGNVLSNVLYNALTSGSLQSNATDDDNGTLVLTNEQKQAIGENIALIQQLITQPSSPFCNPKPTPVQDFNVNAFMGQWYQVLYSPPLSPGPCSMVAYKKLADVANSGPGTVFDTFEYTTEGTPFGRPRISSGYAIIRAPGELIYRTTNSQNDVNVHVIGTGPINAAGEYDYVIMSVNCNYPLHVFARDPVAYKQTYEGQVNALLEQRGLTNGFSRLLNIVAPVDSTLCNFPPTLFNIQG